ncbi:MAG: flagellin [Thermoguttaceae bacterium]
MAIYFNTNPMESQGLLSYQRTTNTISNILKRLETGFRINSAKDDPSGLIIREGMRSDMKLMQSAINNNSSAMNVLNVAESGMASIASLLNGSPDDAKDTGLLGLLMSAGSSSVDAVRQGVFQMLDSIDYIAQSTTFGGKQIINGAYGYNVLSTGANRDNISDINFTKANVNGNTPLDLNFSVTNTAKTAGIKLADSATALSVAAGATTLLTFTDTNGRSIMTTFDNSAGGGALDLSTSEVANAINISLAADTSVNLTASLNAGGDLVVESPTKGANQTLKLTATDGNGLAVAVNFADANGKALWVGGLTLTSKGEDWKLSGLEGNISTNGDYVSVFSNAANFSANLSQAVVGDKFDLQVAGGTEFQLGKDINSANRYKMGIASVNTVTLGGKSGKLNDLRSLDFTNNSDVQKAIDIVNESITSLAIERGQIGSAQTTLNTNRSNLEDQLTIVTDAEAEISNTDVALESSRLARQELIAQSAVNSIMFARAFTQYAVSSLY